MKLTGAVALLLVEYENRKWIIYAKYNKVIYIKVNAVLIACKKLAGCLKG